MLDAEDTTGSDSSTAEGPTTATDAPATSDAAAEPVKKTAKKTAAKKAAKKAPAKKAAKKAAAPAADGSEPATAEQTEQTEAEKPKKAKKSTRKTAATAEATPGDAGTAESADEGQGPAAPMVLFQPPEKKAPARKRAARATAEAQPADGEPTGADADESATDQPPAKKTAKRTQKTAKKTTKAATSDEPESQEADASVAEDEDAEAEGGPRRRRRRGGRRRRKATGDDGGEATDEADQAGGDDEDEDGEGDDAAGTRRRRTRVRKPRNPEDEITSIGGSTRLEAKKQRRREGREAGRRRAPIVSEAEFLARREAVDRVMVVRQRDDLTQIGVIEDKVLVEHYVARESQTSLIGNIYLGRVQNVLPSMEAAFVDIGKGRNAVLYAGEVNWSALGHKDGQPRKVESVLKSGQTILVQVTKDPVGHKGARLTGQISLPGRFLVYVPDGNTSGISRKLPDTERNRLKALLKEIVPDTAGVIVRTAAEGASEDELTQDVERLTARWADIEKKVKAGNGPELLYGEPDLTLKVVRDLFTEDFSKLVIQGEDAWDLVDGYVSHVAPDLRDRLERFEPAASGSGAGKDVFAAYRVDEQIAKGLDRKVWLPSGGSLVIDRTEAMTVVDVNTGKFTGSGGNLEETVTKNNLEAAEEIVRQLRLRDIGGIIVVDFIDMVLESNRDLVLRRLVECLGRDRTRHQVAEVTSLGLVQMTRKRIGTGLLEAFSEDCEHCKGRGVVVHEQPVEPKGGGGADEGRGRRGRGGSGSGGGGRGRGRSGSDAPTTPVEPSKPSPMALAGTKPHPENAEEQSGEAEPLRGDQVENALMGTADDRSTENPIEVTWAVIAQPEPDATPTLLDDTSAPGSQPSPGSAAQPAPEPGSDAGSEAPRDTAPEQVAAPVVVTSTRRRRAGRPAGPPVATPGSESTEDAADTPAPTGGDEDHEPSGPSLLHVPVKKKGSRKR